VIKQLPAAWSEFCIELRVKLEAHENGRFVPRKIKWSNSMFKTTAGVFLACILFGVSAASANDITPDLVGGGWVVDRYAPDSFNNVGTFEGRNNVLGLGISEADGFGNRGGQNSTFYATQG